MKIYYKYGTMVEDGTFWGIRSGHRYDVKQATMLVESCLKAHIGIVLGLAPIVGLVFAVFLPFIGIAMTGKFVWDKVWKRLVVASQFSWSPVMAYFTGRKNRKK